MTLKITQRHRKWRYQGQLSLLPYVGREMSTGQSAVMLCGWEVKAEWIILYVDKRVSGG